MLERTLKGFRLVILLPCLGLLMAGCSIYDYGDDYRYGRHHGHHDRYYDTVSVGFGYGYSSSSYYLYDPFWYLGPSFALNYRYVPSYYFSVGRHPYYSDYYWHYPYHPRPIAWGYYSPRHPWFDHQARHRRPSHREVAREAVRLSRQGRPGHGVVPRSSIRPGVVRRPKASAPSVGDEARRISVPVSRDRDRMRRTTTEPIRGERDRQQWTPSRIERSRVFRDEPRAASARPTVRYRPTQSTPRVDASDDTRSARDHRVDQRTRSNLERRPRVERSEPRIRRERPRAAPTVRHQSRPSTSSPPRPSRSAVRSSAITSRPQAAPPRPPVNARVRGDTSDDHDHDHDRRRRPR